jgi:MoxR-like ATPase
VNDHVSLGSSPRGAQGLLLVGKYNALCDGRFAVSCEDVRRAAPDVLRHRVLLNFQGQARRVRPDDIVRAAVEAVPELSAVGS